MELLLVFLIATVPFSVLLYFAHRALEKRARDRYLHRLLMLPVILAASNRILEEHERRWEKANQTTHQP